MKMEVFEMERMQSTWENVVEYDLSESGIRAVSLRELSDLGFDLEAALDTPLGYSQSNGTIELREILMEQYPGASLENIEVMNGTSEANYLAALVALQEGDDMALEVPNYMQLWGPPRSFGARINTFSLDFACGWEPDWDSFEQAVSEKTRLVYVSNPNNPTGAVLSRDAMRRIIERCERVGAYLLADEVYMGAEREQEQTPSFWGMSDRVIVTSGLSKAYGIPGLRIGWIVGPKEFVTECWTQHDYITIGPNKLSDIVARTAVKSVNRKKLYDRTRRILQQNLKAMQEWLDGFGGFFTYNPHVAGAFNFVKYNSGIPSLELVHSILNRQSTLIIPGRHLGMEGFLRIWMGGNPDFLREGWRRIGIEINQLPELVQGRDL
ncbi:MAG: aminotransferase class I/II-fold pyridoxal phosphate-dependent enzyme [Candidatus Aminicenantaceae bacterium]